MKRLKILFFCLVFGLLASPLWADSGMVGLGAGITPEYEGSSDDDTVPMAMFQYNFDNGAYINFAGTTLRANALPNKRFSFGPLLNYRPERDDVDNDVVDNMKKIDATYEFGIFGAVKFDDLTLSLDWNMFDITDEHNGMTAQANINYAWQVIPELTLTPGAFITYADQDYMDTYFGINPDNRGTNMIRNYKADGGIKDVGLNLVAHYIPFDKWGFMGLFSYKSLQNSAKDSPLTEDEGDDEQITAGLMVTYRWGQ